MNNLVIGGAGWTYYETIGGGQGASARGDGASGVHVGMSNTLNTPVEALELEYPMRVERYELGRGSGGEGGHRGGDGDRARGPGARAGHASRCSPTAAGTRRRAPRAAAPGARGAARSTARSWRPR